jgi:hydroxymethylpyrimidine pyrophosphatase-like HAD family hydrolase
MILPTGINKETGVREALASLGLSEANLIAVGDAENDHALLNHAALSVAVGNALESLKEDADLTMKQEEGAGVSELIEHVLEDEEMLY